MKIGAIAAVILVVEGTAAARNIEVPDSQVIPVCMEHVITRVNVAFASFLAGKMFATAGVNIKWRSWDNCPAGAIRLVLSEDALETDHPNSYGYALPFEGTRIVIFMNRIAAGTEKTEAPYLLAHVMVHEITHILEGICRHSETGVMKPVFRKDDLREMQLHPLPFAPEDIELLQAGIRHREARLVQLAGLR